VFATWCGIPLCKHISSLPTLRAAVFKRPQEKERTMNKAVPKSVYRLGFWSALLSTVFDTVILSEAKNLAAKLSILLSDTKILRVAQDDVTGRCSFTNPKGFSM
jgi:hypothetical protein